MSLFHLKTWIFEEFIPLLIISFNTMILMSTLITIPIIAFACYKWKISIFLWIGYYSWVWYDMRTLKTEGRKIQWFNNLPIFKYARKYFSLRLYKTADIPPHRNYLFACFPHGFLPNGLLFNIIGNGNKMSKLFPGIDFRASSITLLFLLPVAREYLMGVGGCTVDDANLTYLLSHTGTPSKGVIIFPGGTKECLNSRTGAQYTIVKNNRKGFIRIALVTGYIGFLFYSFNSAPLVPVFTFGEQNCYDQEEFKFPVLVWIFNILYKLTRLKINYIKGRGFFQQKFGILPHRRPLTTVVGEPILVPKIENPSSSLIDEYHEKFYEALKDLFEKKRGKYDEAGDAATWNTI